MTERHLMRRPTWYRYAVIFGLLTISSAGLQVRHFLTGHGGTVPLWVLLFGGALFTLAVMSEMSATVCWDDSFVRMYARWGFRYLGGKNFQVALCGVLLELII